MMNGAAAWLGRRILDRIDAGLAAGAIEAVLPDGTSRPVGGAGDGPVARITLHRWRALTRLVTAGSIGWYRGWEDGDWSSPDPVPIFDLFMRNRATLGDVGRSGGPRRWIARLRHWKRRNHPSQARANIEAHYDLGNDFYDEWLDPTMSYSSAIFAEPGEPLEAAQRRKVDALLDRLDLTDGDRLLEIGCGWGFLAEQAARRGARVEALTLSQEQKRIAEERLAAAGLTTRATVTIRDYRDASGTNDAIASVEMVEAVGEAYWPAYLDAIARCLKPGGRAAIQFISIDDAIFDAYAGNVDFIQRYIFPGGMLISEPRFRALAEVRGLRWTDRHGFGADYAETLRIWRERFDAADLEGRLPTRLDARFRRMWRFYLMYCEGGFRGGGIDVAQVTLVRQS
ncbi:cyclopropane-fatty-acyl-phospholipid synthase [Sphingomonas gellani]|uniref:Cyclopropane-fatty-acyl-phospholipid synthase n=2 Tax=Sphingomonas gellani TaxID=1166340 RepID=A0A1H7Z1Y3_9SPHN|nr:cyclopropane-fatty-acyl-phospholipid synthase [Sphingomonas gellani]